MRRLKWGWTKLNFNVKDVEFDFDDDYANGFKLTFDEEIELRDLALGIWEADDEDDLIEEITAASGGALNLLTTTFNSRRTFK